MRTKALTLFSVILLQCSIITSAQPGTEVYLFDMTWNNGAYELGAPINVSNNPGYDNQPSFSRDGRYLYYTSWQSDEQTDIMQYEVSTGVQRRITATDGSEYSPTEMPGSESLSTILLERDGRQLLWEVKIANGDASILVPDLKIGYHCWFSADVLFSFVLGEPNTLQSHDVAAGRNTILDTQIGRSLHKIPGEEAISYVSKKTENWKVLRYNPTTRETSTITPTLPKAEDIAWTHRGEIMMGSDEHLYIWKPGTKSWLLMADLSDHNLANITRLAINPLSTKLAIIVND